MIDTTPPHLYLLGNITLIWRLGIPYNDPGAVAYDEVDGDLTSSITIDSDVNIMFEGNYTVIISVFDKSGNQALLTRHVIVVGDGK